jgi:exo-beta-1,3-glucanase (GH17 family)
MRTTPLAACVFALATACVGCLRSAQNGRDAGPTPGPHDDGGGPPPGTSDGGAPPADLAPGGGATDLAMMGDASPPGGGSDMSKGDGTRVIPPEVLARQAISYSGYRSGQSPDTGVYPTQDQIKQDLQLLVRGGWTFIRLFDCSQNLNNVVQVIKDNALDIKVLSGVYISGPKASHDADNQAEIERCVPIYTSNPDIIVAVSVGNETLDDWSNIKTPVPDLVGYIQEVRGRITQPVTTNDMAPPFMLGTDGNTQYADVVAVVQAIDFLNIHVYPFLDAPYDAWDWKQTAVAAGPDRAVAMMNAAFAYTKMMIDGVRTATTNQGFHLPILIGETGWKSFPAPGDMTEPFLAHPVNEKMYHDAITSWIYGANKDASSPLGVFYFEGFDEPWKSPDDGWGLFDVNRYAKYAVWDQFPDLKPPGAPNYTVNDAVYYH